MDLIKSGSCIDTFYAKTCAITKINTVAGYHIVLAMFLFYLASYCGCTDWIESDLLGNSRRHIFSWCGSFVLPSSRHTQQLQVLQFLLGNCGVKSHYGGSMNAGHIQYEASVL